MSDHVLPHRLLIWLAASCLGWLLVISAVVQLPEALVAYGAAAYVFRQRGNGG